MKNVLLIAMLSLAVAVLGCEKAQEKPGSKEDAKPAASNTPATAKPTAAKSAEPPAAPSGHHGSVIELGNTTIGSFSVRASRDQGEIKPGGDAPIDVWIDGGVGKGVTAVRFWIGAEDAKGSIKAKADIEDDKWHTHVEIPSPMPAESKLWIEVEEKDAKKTIGSFDLKK